MSRKAKHNLFTLCLLPIMLCNACTHVPCADEGPVGELVATRIEKEVYWNREVAPIIQQLIQQELTVDTVVQIALLNNPSIQAEFEEIGISLAELVEAGLLTNPVFDAFVRFPDQPSLHLNTSFSVAQSFLDLLLIPLRKKVAAIAFEQTHLRVAQTILNLSFAVQETFYRLQGELAKQAYLDQILQVAEIEKELAEGQSQQNNINQLDLQFYLSAYLDAQTEYNRSQLEIIRLREEMNRLLGFAETLSPCRLLKGDLPPLPAEEPSLNYLEDIALTQRLDIEVARLETQRIAEMLGLKQWWAYSNLEMGISTEREAEGFNETGPQLSGSIPLFNWGQADRAKLFAQYRQSQECLKALEIDVLSNVRSARDQLMINRELALAYQQELLPLQEKIVSTSQEYYQVMALSVYKLLQAKKQELHMKMNERINLMHYWLSRVELDKSLGGHLE